MLLRVTVSLATTLVFSLIVSADPLDQTLPAVSDCEKQLGVTESVGPFSRDDALRDSFLQTTEGVFSDETKELISKVKNARRIKEQSSRIKAAVKLIPDFQNFLNTNNIAHETYVNENGEPGFIILPGTETAVNRLAQLVMDGYDFPVVFNPIYYISRNFGAYVRSPLEAPGHYAMSITSIMELNITETEGHELVHLETDRQVQNGIDGLFLINIITQSDADLNQIPFRTEIYDRYIQADELVAYTHSLIEMSRTLRYSQSNNFKGIDRIARLLAQLGRRIEWSTELHLEKFLNVGGYFKIYRNRSGDKNILDVRSPGEYDNLIIKIFDPEMIASWEQRELATTRCDTAYKELIRHEASFGKLNSLLTGSPVEKSVREDFTYNAFGRNWPLAEGDGKNVISATVENNLVVIKYKLNDSQVGEYPVQNSLQSINFAKAIENENDKKVSTDPIFTEIKNRMKLLAEVSKQIAERASLISQAAKQKDLDEIERLLNELALYLQQYQYLNTSAT